MKKIVLFCLLFTGCAGLQRDCASGCASNIGSDWVIVQFAADGHTIHCWELHDVAVDSDNSNDVYWQTNSGHLVHIEGWYNRVQVQNGDFSDARRAMGLGEETCIQN